MSDQSKNEPNLPPPPISPDIDLRDFAFMPLEVQRLRDSDLGIVCSDAEIRAALWLWCASWHQIPAGSLPNDPRALAALAGFGRTSDAVARWTEVASGALRGFVACSDGRLYHLVICAKAAEAWNSKERYQERRELFRQNQSAKARKRWGACRDDAESMPLASPRHDPGIQSGTASAMPIKVSNSVSNSVRSKRDSSGRESDRSLLLELQTSSRSVTGDISGSAQEADLLVVGSGEGPSGMGATQEQVPDAPRQDLGPQHRSLAYPESFITGFWEIYPRPVGKLDASNAWKVAVRRAGGGEVGQERIKAAAQAFAKACVGKDPKFIPHPSTWLRGGRWDDPAEPTSAKPKPSGYIPMGNE